MTVKVEFEASFDPDDIECRIDARTPGPAPGPVTSHLNEPDHVLEREFKEEAESGGGADAE